MSAFSKNNRPSFGCNTALLLEDIAAYYGEARSIALKFGDPSYYFHRKSIEWAEKDFLSERHLEYIYATLISWGMHRMGDPEKVKAKLTHFDLFSATILAHRDLLKSMDALRLERLSSQELHDVLRVLKDTFLSLKVSISESVLVANSKTLHHILPHLIPPIDRQYTVRFFTCCEKSFKIRDVNGKRKWRQVNLPDGKDRQYQLFLEICSAVHGILCSDAIKSKGVLERFEKDRISASLPKLVDDLIIGFVTKNGGALPHPMEPVTV